MTAQQFLGVHRQQIAIEHGGRLEEGFRQRQRRQLHRKAAGHQDAALDVVDPGLEMHVAGLRIRPGVEDRDHRPALPFLRRIAHLHRARAMAKGPQIIRREPARAAERFRCFLVFCHDGTRAKLCSCLLTGDPWRARPAWIDREKFMEARLAGAGLPGALLVGEISRQRLSQPLLPPGMTMSVKSIWMPGLSLSLNSASLPLTADMTV